MFSGRITDLWRNKRRTVVTVGLLVLLGVISLAVNLDFIVGNSTQSVDSLEACRSLLEKKQKELKLAVKEEQLLQAPILKVSGMRQKFWLPKDGRPEHELRRRVEQCAKAAGLQLKTMGATQTVKNVEGLNSYSFTVNAQCKIVELVDFLHKIEQEKPEISWQNITINPDNNKAPNFLLVTATAQIVVLDMPGISQQIWSK